jgi:hypothetical protein
MTEGTVDTDFGDAVRSASDAIFSRDGKASTEALVECLLSNRPLGSAERRYLAEMIAGEFRRRKGKPSLRGAERTRRRDAVARLAALKAQWRAEGRRQPFHAEALETVAAEIGVDIDTLSEWHRTKKYE